MRRLISLVLLVVLLPHASFASERDALEELFDKLNGKNWLSSAGWTMPGSDPCTWFGVQCNGGHVVLLRLPTNRVRGDFGALEQFKELTELGQLELWNDPNAPPEDRNLLIGRLPKDFDKLVNLFYVDLRFNQIADRLNAFTSLTKLTHLALEENRFLGEIPGGLGGLKNLTILELNGNELTDTIPKELGQLTNLQKLWLYNNALDSVIPPELGDLKNLQELRLGGNTLHDAIPPEIGKLAELKRLELGLATLSGSLPKDLEKLSNLEILSLGTNRLSGPLDAPDTVDWNKLTALQEVYLDTNLFSGSLPPALAALTSLRILRLRGNGFAGDVPDSYLSFASHAAELDLRWNALDPAAAKTTALDGLSHGEFSTTQTRVPREIEAFRNSRFAAGGPAATPLFVRWQPIPFVAGDGGYEIGVSYVHAGTPVVLPPTIVAGKEQGSAIVYFPPTTPLPALPEPVLVTVTTLSDPNPFNPGPIKSLVSPPVTAAIGQGEGIAVFDHERFAVREGDVLVTQIVRVNGDVQDLKALVSAEPDTASHADFNQPRPPRLTWKSGDSSPRTVKLPTVADRRRETTETLTLILDSPSASEKAVVEIGDQTVAGTAEDPVIATNSDGVSFAAWTQPQPQPNSQLRDVFGRFLDSSGHATGAIITVAADPALDEHDPEVVALDDDTFLVAWIQESSDGSIKDGGLCRPTPKQPKCTRYISPLPEADLTGLTLAAAGSSVWLGWTTPKEYFASQLTTDGVPQGPPHLIATTGSKHSFSEPQLVLLGSDRLIAFWTSTRISPEKATAGGEIQSQSFSSSGDLLAGGGRTYDSAEAEFQRQPRAVAATESTALLAWIETGKTTSRGTPQIAWTEVLPVVGAGETVPPVQRAAAVGDAVVRLGLVREPSQCQIVWLSATAAAQQVERRSLANCSAQSGVPLPPTTLDLLEGIRESFAATATQKGLLLVEQLVADRGVRWLRTGLSSF